jgi:hypothetical protein
LSICGIGVAGELYVFVPRYGVLEYGGDFPPKRYILHIMLVCIPLASEMSQRIRHVPK